MRYADSDPSAQIILISLVIVCRVSLVIKGGESFSGSKGWNSPALSGQLECRAMQSAGELSAPAWPCAYTSMGGLFVVAPSIRTNWPLGYFEPDIVNFHAVGKATHGPSSRSPQLEGTGGASALIPGDGCIPCSLVGSSILAIGWMFAQASAPPPFHGFPARLCGTARYHGANARNLTDPAYFGGMPRAGIASRQAVHTLGLLHAELAEEAAGQPA